MSVKISKHGKVLATMKAEQLISAHGSNNKKRNRLIVKELSKRGKTLEV